MPRGITKTHEEKIAEIDDKIKFFRAKIDALESKKKELAATKQSELAAKLVKLANEKGISIEDMIESMEK